MSTFTIIWENEINNASSPLEAAKLCFEDIRNGHAVAFTVTNELTNESWSVDLSEPDEDAVSPASASSWKDMK